MLKNNKLLYDQDCPMCKVYGACFVKFGLVEKNTLDSYQEVSEKITCFVNMDRARNEIALYDEKTKKTIYGIDAIEKILFNKSGFLYNFMQFDLVDKALRNIYSLISFNRKLIINTESSEGHRDCKPDFNLKFRVIYVLLALTLSALMFSLFLLRVSSFSGMELVGFSSLALITLFSFQSSFAFSLNDQKAMDYLGNLATIFLVSNLFLLPFTLFSFIFNELGEIFLIPAFAIITLLMVAEHFKRTKSIGLGITLSGSWILLNTVGITLLIRAS